MKTLILSLLLSLGSGAFASPSALTQFTQIGEFGSIHYRPPIHASADLPIVMLHGIYGGASHRTFKSVHPLLDAAGKAVYLVDLPGIGESFSPKRPYTLEDIDRFVEMFLQDVVQGPSIVVAESLLTLSSLKVASSRPDLIRRIVMLSPTGLKSLNEPPSERQQRLYDRLYADDQGSLDFYNNLLGDNSLRFFLKFGFYNDDLIDEALLDDFRAARAFPDQRYLSLSFVGGQLYRSFEESSRGVFVPVLGLFGEKYEAFQDNEISKAEDFQRVRPAFEYIEIVDSGSSVQREKPERVVEEILIFSERD